MSSQPPGLLFHRRVDRLAARVRWLDRYLIAQVAGVLGADWPQIHATVLSVMLGVIVWWVIEVGLVYVTALWETEHDRLLRERGLPRAVLRRPRVR